MESLITATMDRMDASQVYHWNANIVPAAATIVTGVYYAGGPECLEARDDADTYLGSILRALVARGAA